MEETPEGLAAAAATREAIKRKRQEDGSGSQEAPTAKKGTRPPPNCSHEVQLPEGFDAGSIDLDPQTFGAPPDPADLRNDTCAAAGLARWWQRRACRTRPSCEC